MSTPDQSPQERIIVGTIAAIEAEGIQNVTTRSIARHAGVNSAAINYYFRTKDLLIAQVLEFTLNNAFGDLDEFIPDGPLTDTAPLKAYYRHIVWGMRKYPRISQAHLYEPMVNRSLSSRASERLNEFLATIYEKLTPGCPAHLHERMRLSLVQLQSALLMSGLAPEAYQPFIGDRLDTQESLDRYVDQFVDDLIGQYLRSVR
ncbi:MAG: TetR/AcrR family transcriptional regulator [Spirochaetales bacterium]|nr:TetR/AcrR family transcriptional regulator [Spirochaetales bacterium]